MSDDIEDMLTPMRAAFRAMGHPLTDEHFDSTARYARGEITHDELMESITDRAGGARPVAQLPAPDEEAVELEGNEEWLTTVDEPDDR